MAKQKSTKKTLLTSMLSLVLCMAMFIGTTFAWFTDSVTSANNRITAGNLDIELEYYTETGWKTVKDATDLFTGNLWEPGHTEVVYFRLTNKGTLALKYQLGVNIVSETGSVNVEGDNFKLSQYIEYGVVEGKQPSYEKREDAVAAVKDNSIAIASGYSKSGNMEKQNDTLYLAMVVYMPETVGNEANYATGAAVPTINLGVNLLATQYTYESDSFDEMYDENAEYVDPWDGEVADELNSDDATMTVTISTAGELALFAEKVNGGNNYKGWTVLLADNINLNNVKWSPIGPNADAANKFAGTFDGQYHTIYNLNVEQEADYHAAGLFGALNGTVKNLNVENANINSLSSGDPTDNGIAVIAGSIYTTGAIDNCHVTNANVNGNRYVAGIAGYVYGSITNCSVTDSFIVATCDNLTGEWNNGDKTGGIAGYFASENTYKIEGNTVADTTIVGYRDLGGIAGYAVDSVTNNKISNVTIIQNNAHNYKNYTSNDETDAGSIVGDGAVDASNTGVADIMYTSDGKIAVASDKASLTTSISSVEAGGTVMLTDDIDCGAGQLAIEKDVTIDLNDKTLSADYGWGIISMKNGASLKNGTIDVKSNIAAIRAFDVGSIEDVTINITPKATEKVATGIAVQNGGYVGTIKNVTITGATQGIEVGKGAKVDIIENASVQAVSNGSKAGTALIINAGYVGKAVNCSFKGEVYGVHMMLNGEFTVGLDLEKSTVTGGEAGIYAHDEVGISNTTNCSLKLTYDAETVINGGLVWEFEDECKSVVTLNAPSGN